jgi:glucose-6-phosphate dehydrogenase assembly protein OpcA
MSKAAYTPGSWRIGRTKSTIVCDTKDETTHHTLYSGALIAESIKHEPNARLIAASPIMFDYLNRKATEGDADAAKIIASIIK